MLASTAAVASASRLLGERIVESGGEWIVLFTGNHLMAHPAVAQAAVIAVPDDRWVNGRWLVICLHANPGRASSSATSWAHLARDFAKYRQLPGTLHFVGTIPHGHSASSRNQAARPVLRQELEPD